MELVQHLIKTCQNDEEVAKCVKQILVIGRNKRQISKHFFEVFVKKYYVCNTADKKLYVEDFKEDTELKSLMKELFANYLSDDPGTSDYGECIISDRTLYCLTKGKITKHLVANNIIATPVQIHAIEKGYAALNAL
jgi:hypothetical protein